MRRERIPNSKFKFKLFSGNLTLPMTTANLLSWESDGFDDNLKDGKKTYHQKSTEKELHANSFGIFQKKNALSTSTGNYKALIIR